MQSFPVRLTTLSVLILSVAFYRLVPGHWPNVTPVAAMALFGGAMFERRWLGLVVPLAAMLLSDALLGFHALMGVVYLCFGLTWAIGRFGLARPTLGRVIGASVLSSLLFFLITNGAVWYDSHAYPQTMAGLMACYTAGLVFYNQTSFALNGLLGDLFFSGLLFGSYALLQRRFAALRLA